MQKGQIDIGFIFDMDTPLPPDFNRMIFSVEGLAAVVPRTHRLAKRATLELDELKGEPIIAGDTRWERYTDMVNEHCIARGFSLRDFTAGLFARRDAFPRSGRHGCSDLSQLHHECRALWFASHSDQRC